MAPRLPASQQWAPTCCQCLRPKPTSTREAHLIRQFHSSPAQHAHRATRLKRDMMAWLKTGPGRVFYKPLPGSSNYLSAYDRYGNLLRAKDQGQGDAGKARSPELSEEEIVRKEEEEGLDEEQRARNAMDRASNRTDDADAADREGRPKERLSDLRPFPLNKNFVSQAVLSEELREELYHQVAEVGHSVEDIAATFRVDVRRVAAVVRLKTIEKKWETDGKQLAKPYAKAVMGMLPQTPYYAGRTPIPHESINDLPVHPRTRQQMFYPTSESRQFTREDAARAFDDNLLPADKRIPLPVLIAREKMVIKGMPREKRVQLLREELEKKEAQKQRAIEKQADWQANNQRIVPTRRWDFKFENISAENVDKNGRGRHAMGYRYGVPHQDRKRGMIKIPTSVE